MIFTMAWRVHCGSGVSSARGRVTSSAIPRSYSMKRFLLPVLVLGAMAFTVGCTTKKEVTRQVTPVMNKLDELDEQTARTTRGIHETDDRAQQGIAGVEAKA